MENCWKTGIRDKDFMIQKVVGFVVLAGLFAGISAWILSDLQVLEKSVLVVKECSQDIEKQCFVNRIGEVWLVTLPFVELDQFVLIGFVPLSKNQGNFQLSLDVQVNSRFNFIGNQEIYQNVSCMKERCTNIDLFFITNTNYTEYSVIITSNSLLPGNSIELHLSYINPRIIILKHCTLICFLSLNLFFLFKHFPVFRSIDYNDSSSLQLRMINFSLFLFDFGLLVDWRLLILKNSMKFRSLCKSQFILMIFWFLSYDLFSLDPSKYQKVLFIVESLLIFFISIIFYQFSCIKLDDAENPFNDFKAVNQSILEELSALQTMLNLKLIWTLYRFISTFQFKYVETFIKKVRVLIHMTLYLLAFSFLSKEMQSLNPALTDFQITLGLHLSLFTLQYLEEIQSSPLKYTLKKPSDHLN